MYQFFLLIGFINGNTNKIVILIGLAAKNRKKNNNKKVFGLTLNWGFELVPDAPGRLHRCVQIRIFV